MNKEWEVEATIEIRTSFLCDTREEATRYLLNILPFVGTNIKEALEMAIKALEQEPCKEGEYLKSAIRISKNIPKEMVEKVFFDTQAKMEVQND